MGSYMFANQYQNEIIPEGEQTFKKHWFRYYSALPKDCYYYAFIDPAISEADTADYTALVVIAVDKEQNAYVVHASRQRINPSEIIKLAFNTYDRYKPKSIGIEDVAFQRAIVHFAHEEMKRRKKVIPITGVKRLNNQTKEMRILSLVPRFEWGTLLLTQGMHDLEIELGQFPRCNHDDILDSLASVFEIVSYPTDTRRVLDEPSPADTGYESHYIEKLIRRRTEEERIQGSF